MAMTNAVQRLARLYAFAIPIGLAAALVVLISTSQGLRTIRGGRIGGDLPAFYGAGRIIRSDQPTRLYDAETQQISQRDLFPDSKDGWIPFAYPPFVAVAYVPLTFLSFKLAYALHTLLMAVLCAVAVVLIARSVPALQHKHMLAIAAALTFYPIFRSVLGGQNTALSLACSAGAAVALARKRAFAAGLSIGAWLFKPQLALTVAALVLLRTRERTRFLLGLVSIAALYYVVAMVIAGPAWPIWWWRAGAMPLSQALGIANQGNVISLPELGSAFGFSVAGWIAAAAVAVATVRWTMGAEGRPIELVTTASAAAVLIAPHALYYDAGLVFLLLLVCVAQRPGTLPVAGAAYLVAWMQPFRPALPVPPLTLVVLVSLWLSLRQRREPAAKILPSS
jgi:hypothetical protein